MYIFTSSFALKTETAYLSMCLGSNLITFCNLILMSDSTGVLFIVWVSPKFELILAHEKFGIWTGPYIMPIIIPSDCATIMRFTD